MIYELIDRLIAREGGFVNHPDDRGGPTNMGITMATLQAWRKTGISINDVEDLDIGEARQIYFANYWQRPGLNTLAIGSYPLDMLFDSCVLHGPTRTVRLLQACLGCHVDGKIGPITRECAGRLDGPRLMALFMAARVEMLGEILTQSPRQSAFAHGWMRRMGEFIKDIPLA